MEVQRDKLKTLLDWAKFYLSFGFSVIPISVHGDQERGVRPKAPVNPSSGYPLRWDDYQQRIPEEDELQRWFGNADPEKLGIGLISGNVSKLIVLEFDQPRYVPIFFSQLPPTWISRSFKGIHVLLRYSGNIDFTIIGIRGKLELRGNGHYTLEPPSKHPEGIHYSWEPGHSPLEMELMEIDEQSYAELKFRAQQFQRYHQLIDKFSQIWIPEHRHNLSLWLSGYLRKSGLSFKESEFILKSICLVANDEEIQDRLRAVKDTYSKSLDQIAGITHLRCELESYLGEESKSVIQILDASLKPGIEIEPIQQEISRKLSDVFIYSGDRKFEGRVQIKGISNPVARFLRLEFRNHEGESLILDFDSTQMDASSFACYFDSNSPESAINILKQRGCKIPSKLRFVRGYSEVAITRAILMDRLGNEARGWFVHSQRCNLERIPNWILAKGYLCKGSGGRIGVLVTEFVPEAEALPIEEELVEESRRILRQWSKDSDDIFQSTGFKIAQALQSRFQLKGEWIAKAILADLLTIASPVWIKTPEGPPQLGATTCEIGPTTTAKSLRIRGLIEWLGAGKYATGPKTEAGLAAGLEKIEGLGWVVKKGLLPSCDLSFLVVDNMDPHALDNYLESRRDGIIQFHKIRYHELWARTRLKLVNNPKIPFQELMFKCLALKMFDPKMIARFAFCLPTMGADPDVRYNPDILELSQDQIQLLEAARIVLRDHLSRESLYQIPENLWPITIELAKKLEMEFGNEDIPLFLRANPYKLGLVSYGFALLDGETQPREIHLKLGYNWLRYCGLELELDKYSRWWNQQHQLSDSDYHQILDGIQRMIREEQAIHGGLASDTIVYTMLDLICRRGKIQASEIAEMGGVDERTVKRKAARLKALGILKSTKDGYGFTGKGVRFIRRLMDCGGLEIFEEHNQNQ